MRTSLSVTPRSHSVSPQTWSVTESVSVLVAETRASLSAVRHYVTISSYGHVLMVVLELYMDYILFIYFIYLFIYFVLFIYIWSP